MIVHVENLQKLFFNKFIQAYFSNKSELKYASKTWEVKRSINKKCRINGVCTLPWQQSVTCTRTEQTADGSSIPWLNAFIVQWLYCRLLIKGNTFSDRSL